MILWVGAREVVAGAMTLGELVAFLSYLALFYVPINQIHSVNAFFVGLPISRSRFWPSTDPVYR